MTRQKSSCYQKGSVDLHNGQWSLRYRELDHVTGQWKWRREKLGEFKSKKAARLAADPIIQAANERNNNPMARAADPNPVEDKSKITFREFIETHWKAYSVKHKRATVDCWGSLIKTHLLPCFGDKVLGQITPTEVTDFLDALRPKVSANTLQSFYNLLRVMFDIGEQYDLIGKSPVRSKLHRPETAKVDKPTLSAAQIRAVIEALPESERLLSRVIAVTGVRLNECLALRWADFGSAGTITINHGLYRGQLQSPKSEASRRLIHVASVVAGLLIEHKAQSAFQSPDDFIFCRADGGPHHPTTLRKNLRLAMEQAKIGWQPRKYGFHIFRHSVGTLVYNKSRDLKLVQGTLGHSNIQTTANIYVHQSDSILAEATEFLAKEICDPDVTQQEAIAS